MTALGWLNLALAAVAYALALRVLAGAAREIDAARGDIRRKQK